MKRFNEVFGIKKTVEDSRNEFVIRVENSIFNALPYLQIHGYDTVFKSVCNGLGVRSKDYHILYNRYADLEVLTKGDFIKTLEVVVALHRTYKHLEPGQEAHFNEIIPLIINSCSPSIGVRWADGMFYPDPIPEIDKQLIDENLLWLNRFPAAKENLQTALKNFNNGTNTDILENCYKALDDVAKTICKSTLSLHHEKLQKDLFQNLKVSEKWRGFLKDFVSYAGDLRHGTDPKRHMADSDEVESFMFLSLIMIRMILKKI